MYKKINRKLGKMRRIKISISRKVWNLKAFFRVKLANAKIVI